MFRNSETAQRMLGNGEGVTTAVDDAPKLIRMSPLRHSFGAHTLPPSEPDDGKTFIKGNIKRKKPDQPTVSATRVLTVCFVTVVFAADNC